MQGGKTRGDGRECDACEIGSKADADREKDNLKIIFHDDALNPAHKQSGFAAASGANQQRVGRRAIVVEPAIQYPQLVIAAAECNRMVCIT